MAQFLNNFLIKTYVLCEIGSELYWQDTVLINGVAVALALSSCLPYFIGF